MSTLNLGQFVAERTPAPAPPELVEQFGSNPIRRVWEVLVPAVHYDAASQALRNARIMHATIQHTAPNPNAAVWGFTFDAVLEAVEALHNAGIPLRQPNKI